MHCNYKVEVRLLFLKVDFAIHSYKNEFYRLYFIVENKVARKGNAYELVLVT